MNWWKQIDTKDFDQIESWKQILSVASVIKKEKQKTLELELWKVNL